jgi:hypothetical protein
VKVRWLPRAIELVDGLGTDLKVYWCQKLLCIIAEQTDYRRICRKMGQAIKNIIHEQSMKGGAYEIR